jgi:hypothetical protein
MKSPGRAAALMAEPTQPLRHHRVDDDRVRGDCTEIHFQGRSTAMASFDQEPEARRRQRRRGLTRVESLAAGISIPITWA